MLARTLGKQLFLDALPTTSEGGIVDDDDQQTLAVVEVKSTGVHHGQSVELTNRLGKEASAWGSTHAKFFAPLSNRTPCSTLAFWHVTPRRSKWQPSRLRARVFSPTTTTDNLPPNVEPDPSVRTRSKKHNSSPSPEE